MITIPSAPVIGGKHRGIWTPGTVTIGSSTASAQPVDVIDLTAERIDNRIVYTGPAYRYFNAAGELTESAINEWPLEYRNGAMLGRREPVLSTTNVITALQLQNMNTVSADTWLQFYTESASNTFHRLRFNTNAQGQLTLQLFYKLIGRDYCCMRATTDTANNYKNIGLTADGKITYIGAGFSNVSVSQIGSGNYLLRATFNYVSGVIGLLTAESAVTNDDVPHISVPDTSAGFAVGYPSLQSGFTGPPLAIGESLAASSVTIDTSSASQIIVYYSDETTESYDTPKSIFTLPAGEQYIQRIEMRK